jgi:AraC-like DNA-binding protein
MQNSGAGDHLESAMQLRSWRPIARLRTFVDHFAIRTASMGSNQKYHPLPARNDCFLEFYLEDQFRVINVASGAIHLAPRVVLVGPHARRREDIIHTGAIKVFHIGFTPTGFYSLFQIPARSIANLAQSAEVVIGSSVCELEEKLAVAPIHHWRSTAEHFLLQRLISSRTATAGHLTARIAHSLLFYRGALPVSELAKRHGRSVRQIERIFEDHVGLSPKLFSRIVRLQAALRMGQRESAPDWSALALAAGYFDQSHMVRDFRALTGETPVGFRRLQHRSLPSSIGDGMSHLSYRRPC